jgi:PEP-CTERM motif
MKLTILKALLIPIALLALGGINQASAGTCAATSYSMTAVTTGGFSCTIGNLTFSNFDYVYEAGIDTGCTGSCTAPSDPNPSTSVTVNFAETSSGSDPYGTAASAGAPIISVITDYSAGNTVNEFQNETGVVQYLVTVTGGSVVTEVDGAITGLATSNGASGDLNKNVCANNQFGGGANPNGNCPNFNTNETIVANDLGLNKTGATQADGTSDWAGPLSLTTLGVYDGWSLDGGTTHASATAYLTSVENDFVDPSSPTPEPGTIVLLGSALVSLGLIRRRKVA